MRAIEFDLTDRCPTPEEREAALKEAVARKAASQEVAEQPSRQLDSDHVSGNTRLGSGYSGKEMER